MQKDTVLLAEDDEIVRNDLKAEFEAWGYRVLEAADIRVALDTIAANRIDAIVLDMRMPDELAGLRLLKAALYYGFTDTSVPIVVFTGYESYENCVAAIRAGAADYVPKGIVGRNTFRELVRRVRELIERVDGRGEPTRDTWLDRNYLELVKRFGGRRIAVWLPDPAQCTVHPEAIHMGGFCVLAADDYDSLRKKILDYPKLRDALPFIAMVPDSGSA